MKNFLTKAFVCAGVLASALMLSSVAAFAAVYTTATGTTVWDGSESLDIGGKNVYSAAGLSNDGDVTGTYWGITFTKVLTNNANDRVDLYNSKVSGNAASQIVITPSIDTKLSVTVGNKKLEISDGINTTTYDKGDQEISLDAGKTYTLINEATSGSGRCYLTKMTLKSASAPTYTATLNLTNNSNTASVVKLNNKEITVPANGNNVLEVTGLSESTDYAITTDPAHILSLTTVNLSANTSYNVTVSAVPNINDGDYGSNEQISSKGFITDITSNKYSQKNYFGFTLSKPATVTITAQCGSNSASTDTKSAKLFLADNYSATSGTDILSVGTASSGLDYSTEKVVELSAGTHYFIAASPALEGQDTTSVQVTNINVAYKTSQSYFIPCKVYYNGADTYIIGKINKEHFANVSGQIGLAGNADQTKAETKTVNDAVKSDKVYKAIKIGDAYYGDPNAKNPTEYYFAVKLSNATNRNFYVKGFADGVASELVSLTGSTSLTD